MRLPFGGDPLEFGDEIWRQKTRGLGLPDGEEIMPLAFFVLTQYRRVTNQSINERRYNGSTDCLVENNTQREFPTDTRRRAVSLQQLSFLLASVKGPFIADVNNIVNN